MRSGVLEDEMIPELVSCLDRTVEFIKAQVADLTDDDVFRQPAGVPNHAAWTIGHVAFGLQGAAMELGAPRWLPADWEEVFGYGSSPASTRGSAHSSKLGLVSTLVDAGARLRSTLLEVDEGRLREPLPDPRSREVFATTGDALLQLVAAHTAFHAGQLAAWRRAVGRNPASVFI